MRQAQFRVLGLCLFGCFLLQYVVMRQAGFSNTTSTVDAILSAVLVLLLYLASLQVHHFYQPGEKHWYYRLLFPLCAAALFIGLHSLAWDALAGTIEVPGSSELSITLRFIIVFLVLSLGSLLSWFLYLLEQQRKQLDRKREAEQLVKESELMLIRQQLQPHFLFNSLNSISSLVVSEPERSREMIGKLSELFRLALQGQQKKFQTFAEELHYLKLYLELEQMRCGERLQVELKVAPEAGNAHIPSLLLQPLLENALKFSLQAGKAYISIQVRTEAGQLLVELKNSFDPEENTTRGGTGFGLKAVERRLFLIFERKDLLFTQQHVETFQIQVRIPQLPQHAQRTHH